MCTPRNGFLFHNFMLFYWLLNDRVRVSVQLLLCI
jgi:hypothetical protein